MRALRGEVWLFDFGDPIGREPKGIRPVVVISDNQLNDGPAGLVIVVPTTTTRRALPTHIELDDKSTGLDQVSYARCEDVTSASDLRLVTRLGIVPTNALFRMERALRFVMGL